MLHSGQLKVRFHGVETMHPPLGVYNGGEITESTMEGGVMQQTFIEANETSVFPCGVCCEVCSAVFTTASAW